MMLFAYWPVFVGYFVFKIAKVVITNLHKMVVPTFISLLIFFNWWLPSFPGMEGVNLLVLKKIFVREEWIAFLNLSTWQEENIMVVIIQSTIMIIALLTIYVLPAVVGSLLVATFTEHNLYVRFDWNGVDEVYKRILKGLKEKSEAESSSNVVVSIVVSLICLGMLGAIVYFIPSWVEAGLQAFHAWVLM